jgi:hypothetical protein
MKSFGAKRYAKKRKPKHERQREEPFNLGIVTLNGTASGGKTTSADFAVLLSSFARGARLRNKNNSSRNMSRVVKDAVQKTHQNSINFFPFDGCRR